VRHISLGLEEASDGFGCRQLARRPRPPSELTAHTEVDRARYIWLRRAYLSLGRAHARPSTPAEEAGHDLGWPNSSPTGRLKRNCERAWSLGGISIQIAQPSTLPTSKSKPPHAIHLFEKGAAGPGRKGPAADEPGVGREHAGPQVLANAVSSPGNWYSTRLVGASEAIQLSAKRSERDSRPVRSWPKATELTVLRLRRHALRAAARCC
jgi:hypothetical protein